MDYFLSEKTNYINENSKFFKKGDLQELETIIENCDYETFQTVLNAKFKNPLTFTIVNILFGSIGVDRFMLGDVKLGIIKLITSGGFFIWWIADIFTAPKRAREWNINNLRCIVSNGCEKTTAADRWEEIKNNKELHKAVIKGVKTISNAAKDLQNDMYLDE